LLAVQFLDADIILLEGFKNSTYEKIFLLQDHGTMDTIQTKYIVVVGGRTMECPVPYFNRGWAGVFLLRQWPFNHIGKHNFHHNFQLRYFV